MLISAMKLLMCTQCPHTSFSSLTNPHTILSLTRMSGREKENVDPDITRVRTKCVSSSGVLKPTQPKQNAEPTFSKNIPQRRWTKREDRALLSLVEKYDDRGCIHKASMEAFPMWEHVARDLKTRSARSCRNRWRKYTIFT